MKKVFCLINFLILSLVSNAQKMLTLKDVINEAKTKSIRSKQIDNRFQNSYWRNFSYKRQFLPSLVFEGTLPEFSRTISSVIQPDGSEIFVNRNLTSNRTNLAINQIVPFTGGRVFLRSGLDNIRLSGKSKSTTYLSRPIEIGYSQNLFGFNRYKWENIVEPLYLSEAELLKSEEIEDLAIESVKRYFSLLRSKLSMENAQNNLLNNDTIYLIGKGRYGYGKIAENELLQLELSLLNSEITYEQEKVNFELNKQKLATFLGYNNNEDLQLVLDTLVPNFEISYKEALSLANNYNSKIVQQERKIFESNMEVAKVKSENRFNFNLMASLGLSQTAGTISEVYKSPQNQEFVSLGVRVPIIQWGLGRGRIKQAQSNADLVMSTVEQERIDFNQDVYKKVAEYNLNRKQFDVSKRANEVASKRFEVTKQRYLIGKILITDLQIAQSEKDGALLRYINAFQTLWESYFQVRKITHFDFETREVLK